MVATTKLTIPPILKGERFQRLVERVAQEAVDVTGTESAAQMKRDAPASSGRLRQEIRYEPNSQGVGGRVIAAGTSRRYADVQDKGRRPGARGPSTRHLLYHDGVRQGSDDTGQTGWTQRQMPGVVNSLAGSLRAQYVARLKRGKTKRGIEDFRADARFLLSRSIARRIHRRGMEGERFSPADELVIRGIRQEFGRTLGQVIARGRSEGLV